MEANKAYDSKDQVEPPSAETLKPQENNSGAEDEAAASEAAAKSDAKSSEAKSSDTSVAIKRPRHASYRPSHRATFIGLAVVVVILVVNAGVIFFVVKKQAAKDPQANLEPVTISQGVLDKLGVNRASIGDAGVELVVNPNSRFNGKLQVGGDVSVAGQFRLNSKFSASDASLAKLEAGNTSLGQLNVNGASTMSALNLRNDLVVTGQTRLQGATTISQILTVNNNANIAGSLSVGGALSVNAFQTRNLVAEANITIGGHFITRGLAPRVGPGPALGNNGTVSISGNDAAGTVAANIGTGSAGGIVANVAFRTPYNNTPKVIVTAVGAGLGSVYTVRNAASFSIGVNGPAPPGGYAFDYIVME